MENKHWKSGGQCPVMHGANSSEYRPGARWPNPNLDILPTRSKVEPIRSFNYREQLKTLDVQPLKNDCKRSDRQPRLVSGLYTMVA